MAFKNLMEHQNVDSFSIQEGRAFITNKFGETYELLCVDVPGFGFALHAAFVE